MLTYTFHVSLPGYGRVWRKLALPAEFTLEDLHLAIQNAYEFDNDHLYSFFMSGKAWDRKTEYSLPEDATPWGFTIIDENGVEVDAIEEDKIEEDEDEILLDPTSTALADAVADLPDPADLFPGETLETPNPDELRDMFAQLKENPEMREQFMQAISAQLGLPPLMAQMMLGNMDTLLSNLSDEQLQAVLSTDLGDDDDDDDIDDDTIGGFGSLFGMGGLFDEEEASDVRTTTLASLNLKKGKTFLYLFDYGDEWRFNVKVHAIDKSADPALEYPLLVERVGDAPVQYAGWDLDEEDEEEDEDWEIEGDGAGDSTSGDDAGE